MYVCMYVCAWTSEMRMRGNLEYMVKLEYDNLLFGFITDLVHCRNRFSYVSQLRKNNFFINSHIVYTVCVHLRL